MGWIFRTLILASMSALIGFLAQRSRMCFVAGLRDYFLIRDRELLMGLFSFIITIWLFTSIFYSIDILKKGIPEYGDILIGKRLSQVKFTLTHFLQRGTFFMTSDRGVSVHFRHRFLYVTFFSGLFIGMLSTFSGGCVLRQHVLFTQGNMNAAYFLLGFYCAVVVYYSLLYRFLVRLY